jgi:hypothetical protein
VRPVARPRTGRNPTQESQHRAFLKPMTSPFSQAGHKRCWRHCPTPRTVLSPCSLRHAPVLPWRAAFQIAEPSAQLAEAIFFVDLAIRAATSLDSASRIDALRVLCAGDRSGEDAVEKLVRRVLQSTLYHNRKAGRSIRNGISKDRDRGICQWTSPCE